MQARLVWLPSGDEINFRVIWPDLFLYWLGRLGTDNNFHVSVPSQAQRWRDSLQSNIDAIRHATSALPTLISEWPEDLYDQRSLNKLHRDWVVAGQRFPRLPLLLERMGLGKAWRAINHDIHQLESSFSWQYVNYDIHPWQIPNEFGARMLDHSTSHIMLGFDNLGRSTWEKFCNYDDEAFDVDTNNFEMLSGKVDITLERVMGYSIPEKYQNWCARHQVPVTGRYLRLGNFNEDHHTLSKLRRLFTQNEHDPGHRIIFAV